MHYDLWHRGGANISSNGIRYMFKFQLLGRSVWDEVAVGRGFRGLGFRVSDEVVDATKNTANTIHYYSVCLCDLSLKPRSRSQCSCQSSRVPRRSTVLLSVLFVNSRAFQP